MDSTSISILKGYGRPVDNFRTIVDLSESIESCGSKNNHAEYLRPSYHPFSLNHANLDQLSIYFEIWEIF